MASRGWRFVDATRRKSTALASAETAMRGIPANSPDYLRAQDIAMVSRAEIQKNKKNHKDDEERD